MAPEGGTRGSAPSGSQASSNCRVCYAIQGRAKAEASDLVITCIVLVCRHSTSIIFNSRSIYSYLLTYFVMDIDYACEHLDVPICVST